MAANQELPLGIIIIIVVVIVAIFIAVLISVFRKYNKNKYGRADYVDDIPYFTGGVGENKQSQQGGARTAQQPQPGGGAGKPKQSQQGGAGKPVVAVGMKSKNQIPTRQNPLAAAVQSTKKSQNDIVIDKKANDAGNRAFNAAENKYTKNSKAQRTKAKDAARAAAIKAINDGFNENAAAAAGAAAAAAAISGLLSAAIIKAGKDAAYNSAKKEKDDADAAIVAEALERANRADAVLNAPKLAIDAAQATNLGIAAQAAAACAAANSAKSANANDKAKYVADAAKRAGGVEAAKAEKWALKQLDSKIVNMLAGAAAAVGAEADAANAAKDAEIAVQIAAGVVDQQEAIAKGLTNLANIDSADQTAVNNAKYALVAAINPAAATPTAAADAVIKVSLVAISSAITSAINAVRAGSAAAAAAVAAAKAAAATTAAAAAAAATAAAAAVVAAKKAVNEAVLHAEANAVGLAVVEAAKRAAYVKAENLKNMNTPANNILARGTLAGDAAAKAALVYTRNALNKAVQDVNNLFAGDARQIAVDAADLEKEIQIAANVVETQDKGVTDNIRTVYAARVTTADTVLKAAMLPALDLTKTAETSGEEVAKAITHVSLRAINGAGMAAGEAAKAADILFTDVVVTAKNEAIAKATADGLIPDAIKAAEDAAEAAAKRAIDRIKTVEIQKAGMEAGRAAAEHAAANVAASAADIISAGMAAGDAVVQRALQVIKNEGEIAGELASSAIVQIMRAIGDAPDAAAVAIGAVATPSMINAAESAARAAATLVNGKNPKVAADAGAAAAASLALGNNKANATIEGNAIIDKVVLIIQVAGNAAGKAASDTILALEDEVNNVERYARLQWDREGAAVMGSAVTAARDEANIRINATKATDAANAGAAAGAAAEADATAKVRAAGYVPADVEREGAAEGDAACEPIKTAAVLRVTGAAANAAEATARAKIISINTAVNNAPTLAKTAANRIGQGRAAVDAAVSAARTAARKAKQAGYDEVVVAQIAKAAAEAAGAVAEAGATADEAAAAAEKAALEAAEDENNNKEDVSINEEDYQEDDRVKPFAQNSYDILPLDRKLATLSSNIEFSDSKSSAINDSQNSFKYKIVSYESGEQSSDDEILEKISCARTLRMPLIDSVNIITRAKELLKKYRGARKVIPGSWIFRGGKYITAIKPAKIEELERYIELMERENQFGSQPVPRTGGGRR
jgi:hypothetical protein